jgi:putative DNA primase/helicase
VVKTADGWQARCPAHDDHKPSLGVAVGEDGRVLVHCRVGCTAEAVVAALGLTLADLFPAAANSRAGKAPPPTTDWAGEARRFAAALTNDRRAHLAELLGLPVETLNALPIGYRADDPSGECWTFPELDAAGEVIGINRRWPNGQKKAMAGGKRGLTVPAGWRERAGPLLIPEGASDVLALAAAGMSAVGRPSSTGGVRQLCDLLTNYPHEIVVLGENDQKPSGGWPGRDGAERTAAALAAELGRPVKWALPPGGAKDVRIWFAGRVTDSAGWPEAGADLVGQLLTNATTVDPPASGNGETAAGELDDRDHFTDMGNGSRLVRAHGRDLHYCHPWKKWLIWDGTRWGVDDSGEIMRRAKRTIKKLYQDCRRAIRAAEQRLETNADDREAKALADRATALLKHAVKSQARERLTAMIALAASEPGIPVMPAELDADPFLLNCPNGTVDLRAGRLRRHRREDLLSKLCPTAYDPAAACPRFEQFLSDIFPNLSDAAEEPGDAELIGFVQRLLGYCATGDVGEQVLAIFHGDGANGKSTLLNTVMHVLGTDYTAASPPELLIAGKWDRHPTELADLHGRRLIVAPETKEGARLNEALIKQLTGGDPIRARRMKEDFWQFPPTHTFILQTNNKPDVSGEDNAIWRRLRLVPFAVRFWSPDDPPFGLEERPERLRQDKGCSTS